MKPGTLRADIKISTTALSPETMIHSPRILSSTSLRTWTSHRLSKFFACKTRENYLLVELIECLVDVIQPILIEYSCLNVCQRWDLVSTSSSLSRANFSRFLSNFLAKMRLSLCITLLWLISYLISSQFPATRESEMQD